MIVLMHSSKTMRVPASARTPTGTPPLLDRAEELIDYLRTLSPAQLSRIMTISGDLAAKTKEPMRSSTRCWRTRPMKTFLGPRMATHGVDSPRAYFGDMRRYNCVEQAPQITCPSYVTDNETDLVSTGQGEQLFNALTCPKEFRRFVQKEGAEGHCEGMASVVFWTAAFDWLESTLA